MKNNIMKNGWTLPASLLACGVAATLISISLKPAASENAPVQAPATKVEVPKTSVTVPEGREVATLAAGCFWSMEAIFKQIKGVDKVEPGYAGGHLAKPSYEQVVQANTGHAESVQITFDPKVISYGGLVRVLLTTRNPTTLNKQEPDEGPHYRSEIFAHNNEQAKVAREMIAQITASKIWKDPIVTPVTEFSNFYRAEDYHLNYFALHPNEPYSKYVMAPEIAHFRKQFKELLKP